MCLTQLASEIFGANNLADAFVAEFIGEWPLFQTTTAMQSELILSMAPALVEYFMF